MYCQSEKDDNIDNHNKRVQIPWYPFRAKDWEPLDTEEHNGISWKWKCRRSYTRLHKLTDR
jgi:hypothetical protein